MQMERSTSWPSSELSTVRKPRLVREDDGEARRSTLRDASPSDGAAVGSDAAGWGMV